MFRALVILGLCLVAPSAQATTRMFFSPEIDGTRLDACLSDGTACGKPAADAFCRVQGFDRSTLFQREKLASTRVLDSGQVCSGGSCTAFRQIRCYTAKDDLASAATP